MITDESFSASLPKKDFVDQVKKVTDYQLSTVKNVKYFWNWYINSSLFFFPKPELTSSGVVFLGWNKIFIRE